jgi:type II secretory pathway component PulK
MMRIRTCNNRSGIVLVAVLWVLILLAAMAAAISATARIEGRMCLAEAEQMRAKWACRAGVEKAIALLTDDDKVSDSLTDIWADNPDELTGIELDGCTLDIVITDESGKLNINTATKAQLMGLKGMTDEIADAIVDWRDADDEEQPTGAEGGYYLNTEHPYIIRNGPLQTIRELLMVKGVTNVLFYGEDTNKNGKLDINEMDGPLTPPEDNGDEILDVGWKDFVTVYSYETNSDSTGTRRTNINTASAGRLQRSLSLPQAYSTWITQNRGNGFQSIGYLLSSSTPKQSSLRANDPNAKAMDMDTFIQISDKVTVNNATSVAGMVNVNTAPAETLTALFEGDSDLADAVVAARGGLANGFETLGAVVQSGAMTVAQFQKFANNMTVRSNVFTIKCTATSARTGAKYETETVVDRAQSGTPILYWHD